MIRLLIKIKYRIKNYLNISYSRKENLELKTLFSKYKRAVILGSSPSIRKLNLLDFEHDFVISMGNFYEHPDIIKIKPKIHIFASSHIPITEEVLRIWWQRCNDILPSHIPIMVANKDISIAKEVFVGRKIFEYSYGGALPVDFTKKIISPWSVALIGLQLAIYCKTSEIILLGVNHEWQCIQPYMHFYEHQKPSLEYYLKLAKIKIPYEKQRSPLPKENLYQAYELYQQYENLKEYAQKQNIEIYNGDPFSGFDVFKKISIENINIY